MFCAVIVVVFCGDVGEELMETGVVVVLWCCGVAVFVSPGLQNAEEGKLFVGVGAVQLRCECSSFVWANCAVKD